MIFGWKTKRKHTPTKVESAFELMLSIDGYKVRAYKERRGKTDYRIEKDGVSIEYSVPSDAKMLMPYLIFLNSITGKRLRSKQKAGRRWEDRLTNDNCS